MIAVEHHAGYFTHADMVEIVIDRGQYWRLYENADKIRRDGGCVAWTKNFIDREISPQQA